MEMPEIGRQCHQCHELDYLPFRCDGCRMFFCKDCRLYADHGCQKKAPQPDVRCPTCPVCHAPVPTPRGADTKLRMEQHIASGCKDISALASGDKRRQNRCSKVGCKTVELVRVECKLCRQNFCLKHRSEVAHPCPQFQTTARHSKSCAATAGSRDAHLVKQQKYDQLVKQLLLETPAVVH